MILEIEGSSSGCYAEFAVPNIMTNAQSSVRVIDIHVPDPPLLADYDAAVVTDIDSFSVVSIRNMFDLVDVLDSLTDLATEDRLLEAYWSGTEFEIIAVFKQVTLSAAFAKTLKLPTTLVVNQVYSSCINIAAVDISAGYVVQLHMGELDGIHREDFTYDVATLKRDQSVVPEAWFETRAPSLEGTVRVYSKDRATGALSLLRVRVGERWSVRIEMKSRVHAVTRLSKL